MRLLTTLFVTFLLPYAVAQSRPTITGISHIAVYTSDPNATRQYYIHDIGLKEGSDPENPAGLRYYVNAEQFVEVLPLPSSDSPNRLDHLGYRTTDAEALRLYLQAHGVTVPESVKTGTNGDRWFQVKDPESNLVEFLQPSKRTISLTGANPIGHRVIHVGMLVHSRETEDKFYREVLGFKPYWFGGMKPDKLDWVSQQVPDGHEWLEYMLTSGPSGSGIPANISQKQLGVLDHLSLGVENMEKAVTTLDSEDRLNNQHSGPQIGRDGKWQFNLFDPDGIRLELMEFTNVKDPCCSPFTDLNPSPRGQP